MNKQQQELYEKLLRKVNEYCLGYAAEDVIAAIDALVESYETPKVDLTSKPSKALDSIIETFIDKDSEDIKTVRTALKALEIIKEQHCIYILALKASENWGAYNQFILPLNKYLGNKLFDKLTQKEYEILKEVLNSD